MTCMCGLLVQDAASIAPGDKAAMRKFLLDLPIESMLQQTDTSVQQ